jgi:hypothetical protein
LAEQRHTTAFVVGLVLGGLAGAAVVFWKAPRSGAQTRALIAEKTEEVLFRLTGMDKLPPAGTTPRRVPVSFDAMASRSHDQIAADADTAPLPVPSPASETTAEEEDGARLPTTFRGEVLTEQPTDVVLDGPRPAPADR